MASTSSPLLRRPTCPHCWTSFAPEEILWISAHTDLLGDPRLGPEQQQRFLPTRFDPEGNAIDGNGFVCRTLACPRCHLPLPRALVETEPFFVSILGTPACGKSYYLTAMTWQLRRLLPRHFAVAFSDAEPSANRILNEYEELLFLNGQAEELIPLADLIRKTELQGELYDTVMYGNQGVSYPRPFMFLLQPLENHASFNAQPPTARVVCLYDNAGEHFQPGQDSTASPVTQHVAQSRLLLFLFDPTQDQRFRKLCLQGEPGSPSLAAGRSSRQESVLLEAAARVRRYTGLAQNVKHNRPLVVVLTKFDVWAHLLEDRETDEPLVHHEKQVGLDLDRIEQRSQEIRDLMLTLCPEVVVAAENFAQNVAFVAVSALGRSPIMHPQAQRLAIRPTDIQPTWVPIPLLYGLRRWLPDLVPGFRRKVSQPVADGDR